MKPNIKWVDKHDRTWIYEGRWGTWFTRGGTTVSYTGYDEWEWSSRKYWGGGYKTCFDAMNEAGKRKL